MNAVVEYGPARFCSEIRTTGNARALARHLPKTTRAGCARRRPQDERVGGKTCRAGRRRATVSCVMASVGDRRLGRVSSLLLRRIYYIYGLLLARCPEQYPSIHSAEVSQHYAATCVFTRWALKIRILMLMLLHAPSSSRYMLLPMLRLPTSRDGST